MNNILTFDLEDWYHGNFLDDEYGTQTYHESRVVESTQTILDLLDQTNNKATFFVLGEIAEKYPELIRKIYQKGHEIASHCYEHRLVYNRSKEDFASDLKKSIKILEDIIEDKIIGFRAPYWSVNNKIKWIWEVLRNSEIVYDSSLYPFKTYLYGDNHLPRFSYQIKSNSNGFIEEIPPSVLELFGKRVPFCGGFYFRILPYWLVKKGINKINQKEKQPIVFYLHPYEIDVNKPKSSKGFRNNFILDVNVKNGKKKLTKLINDYRFVSIKEYFNFC